MIYKQKYLSSNWETKPSPFHPNMEILGSFYCVLNELGENEFVPAKSF